jgi:hypothetical protein
MDNTYTLNGNIIVELGGMQITRDQIDAVKVARQKDTDQQAVDYLINCAERVFSNEVEACEYLAHVQEGGDPDEWYRENCHML